jgi:DNA polymerase III sliding clamp (beta) subunit (PCNA family)
VWGDLDASFEVGSVQLSTWLLEGNSHYQKLFPSSYPNRLVVGKSALLDAIRRVKLMGTPPRRCTWRCGLRASS